MDLRNDVGLNSLQRLTYLCQMLRDDADKILSGEMGITITSGMLWAVNEAVDNLQDGLSPPHLSALAGEGEGGGRELEDWNLRLQFILDIMAKAPVLVLYKGREIVTASSMQGERSAPTVPLSVRLGHFTSLRHLEMSGVAVRDVQDLLKMRERLHTLVLLNCTTDNFRLQDVLEMCEAEVAVPMQWTTLRKLCLRSDSLAELDGSLRLCPCLELLDLSRNRLVTTEAYLGVSEVMYLVSDNKYLMELRYVDLSYNDLTVMPAFSATAKKKLRVLLLAGNRIIDLAGVEEMTSLEELDVSENLIVCHRNLLPVRALHRLDKLNMQDCPAAIRKDHRVLALQYVSTVSLSRKFCLDRRQVTHKEIQNSRAVLNKIDYQFSRRYHNSHVPPSPRRVGGAAGRMNTSSSRQEEARGATGEDLAIAVSSARKKKSKKKAKTRMMDIPDMDTSTGGELSSKDVTPSTTPKSSRMEALAQLRRLELQEKRAEMEQLRRCYGNNWLQAVEHQEVIPAPAPDPDPTPKVKANAGDDNKTNQQKKNNNNGAVNSDSEPPPPVVVDNKTASSKSKNQSRALIASADVHAPTSLTAALTSNSNSRRVAERKPAGFFDSGSGTEDGGGVEGSGDFPSSSHDALRAEDESRMTEDTLLSDESVTLGPGEEEEGEGEDGSTKIGGSEQESSAMTNSTQDTMEEPEDQSEPFICTWPGRGDEHLIVTVSPRYLVEKDINGRIQDKLDLQSLEAVRVEVEKVRGQPEVKDMDNSADDLDLEEVQVHLDFSYVRKDRRCRVYVMEDFLTAQHFSELVQPFLDAKVEAALKKMQVRYQCLKCNSEFSRGEARSLVHTDDVPTTGSSRDLASLADLRGEKLVLQCPRCDSDHVVQLEGGEENRHTGEDTPTGSSLGRKQSIDQTVLNRPPRAHSTPHKQLVSDTQTSSSPSSSQQRRGSKPGSFRSLFFPADGQDNKQRGDGPNPNPNPTAAVSKSVEPAAAKDATAAAAAAAADNLPKGRQRSNAFYDQLPPIEARQRSNAVSSPAEFLERRGGSVLSDGGGSSDGGGMRGRSSASNSVTSQDVTDGSRLATFGGVSTNPGFLGSPSSSTQGSELVAADGSRLATFGALRLTSQQAALAEMAHFLGSSSQGLSSEAVPSSVESDIAVINSQNSSGASVEVLACASSRSVVASASSSSVSSSSSSNVLSPRTISSSQNHNHHHRHKQENEFSSSSSGREGAAGVLIVTTTEREDKNFSGESDNAGISIKRRREGKEEEGGEGGDDDGGVELIEGGGSVEVTPMGSPLSSSICSSMVSSVYHNSLLPSSADPSPYVTASELSLAAEEEGAGGGGGRRKEEGGEAELSIYDDPGGETTVTASSPRKSGSQHKASVSSEVEVLCVEEEATPQEWQQSEYDKRDDSDHHQTFPSMMSAQDWGDTPSVFRSEANSLATTTAAALAAASSSSSPTPSPPTTEETADSSGYDFSRLDHRMALYLMMTVFENDDEFCFQVKCAVCQYMVGEEYRALVVVTTLKLYILRVNTEDPSVELKDSLTLMEAQPHAELKRVDCGLGGHTLRLEYSSDCSSYTLVLRDPPKVSAFQEMLSDHLESYSRQTGVPTTAVFREDAVQETLDQLTADVLTRGPVVTTLRLYTTGYIARGHNPRYPMSFVVSSSEVSLVKTNHQWPSPVLQPPVTVETVGKQFTVLERQKINNIATVELHEDDRRILRVTFFNETSGDETRWLVSMETEGGTLELVEALRGPWEEAFGVSMDLEISDFEMSF